jgi:hypothetical protein
MTGDTYSRIGTRQIGLPQLSLALANEDWDTCNVYGVQQTRTVCNVEGRRVIELYDNNAFEILNGV